MYSIVAVSPNVSSTIPNQAITTNPRGNIRTSEKQGTVKISPEQFPHVPFLPVCTLLTRKH